MVTYASDELIPSSEFAKRFGQYLTKIKNNSVKKLAILKNNRVEAVLISKNEYELMNEIIKKVEAQEFLNSISNGLKDIENNNLHDIETLWNKLDAD
jgi:PHD/YefM family antitoxin component YafN of YafNO toxin-antitoxin module